MSPSSAKKVLTNESLQTVFAMHLFDADDLRKTQASFYISTVLISILHTFFPGSVFG